MTGTPNDVATPIVDIRPQTPIAQLDRSRFGAEDSFKPETVAPVVGMSLTFIRKVVGHRGWLSGEDVLALLDQDAFHETFVPRSKILDYLKGCNQGDSESVDEVPNPESWDLRLGNALDLVREVTASSVNCVVTSTPYWGLRIYEDTQVVAWADGEVCAYGHEQTPEGFARHTTETLLALSRILTDDGSIWWNVMDSFNTRTQIRESAAEALRAMQGMDSRKWGEYTARRYSAGHSYLKDGEQCLIPQMIAERASRAGLYVKTVITWAKRSSMPEPQNSRVSRNLEYVLHITKQRTPKLARQPYHDADPEFGGRNNGWESEKLSDVWVLSTSSGGNGHGAQFPTALPGRCIALSTEPGDVVLDPFVGTGTSGIAALHHGCSFIGFDTSQTYLAIAKEKLGSVNEGH
ncbi:MAG TPA: site-specific DNA-methyltransferase [Acidimicrobiia bacterium]|nr:site-specific DNA-methyltransferase [Acidimicrobiia bacterium]